jgi:predicted helicase
MLLPYYVSALNIEHAYFEQTGTYEAFEGLCFVDTLDMAEGQQQKLAFMTEANTARVERQKRAPVTVIIGNPPYNVGQLNENDNNKNRRYPIVDGRVKDTYSTDSEATLKNKLYDPYVRFFRWAVDRLEGRDGIVCYVSNNSFVDQIAFDGMRKHLLRDFTSIYHLDLHGNVRLNPKLSGTTHNVFGIQVGVGITVAVRSSDGKDHRLWYHRLPEDMRREEKLKWLAERNSLTGVQWTRLTPDARHTWLVSENSEEYASFLPTVSDDDDAIFGMSSNGVSTNRNQWVYDFLKQALEEKVKLLINNYILRAALNETFSCSHSEDCGISAFEPAWKSSRKAPHGGGSWLGFMYNSAKTSSGLSMRSASAIPVCKFVARC